MHRNPQNVPRTEGASAMLENICQPESPPPVSLQHTNEEQTPPSCFFGLPPQCQCPLAAPHVKKKKKKKKDDHQEGQEGQEQEQQQEGRRRQGLLHRAAPEYDHRTKRWQVVVLEHRQQQ
mmetsp:Transcript_39931/g.85543  ORF Transcript_39931/g.85543 Transcript_39931/m.85543 type:complete len:120 (+) Transcript_39931:994-1353(+)